MENFDIYYKVISSVVAILFGYHKYITKLISERMSKEDCRMQLRILAEKRTNIEILLEERTKTQFKELKEIKEDLKIIKEHIAKN